MRGAYESNLNDLLVSIFQSVLAVEESVLKNILVDLSITELHTLEAVGRYHEEDCSVSALARDLNVTLPTVTVCIQRLVKKDYVQKIRSEEDGRKVSIALTRKGKRIDAAHRYFHKQMVHSLLKEVSNEARPVLQHALENLDTFLQHQIEKSIVIEKKDGN